MSGAIYLVGDNGQLEAMAESSYATEDDLQRLLAEHADLLAGEQMNAAAPRRWLLLAREAALPDAEDGAGRWSVDHLFVDQDGVPTIVEVKRSSDTRIRREVVGQMLDYAANAVVYWPVEHLRAQFEAACADRDDDPERAIMDALALDSDVERFWQSVKTNLQAGRVRMVFVADVIPSELRRVIEFLNVQMNPAEVLGVEIRQYVGQAGRALVPRIVGQTQQAVALKTGAAERGAKQWNEPMFLESLETRIGPDAAATARKIIDWARGRALDEWWGKGRIDGSFYPMLPVGAAKQWLFSVWTNGRINVEFGVMQKHRPFDDDGKREELLNRLNRIPGVELPRDRLSKWPSLPIAALFAPEALTDFLEAFDWAIQETLAAAGSAGSAS